MTTGTLENLHHQTLDPTLITRTCQKLANRISEHFPEAGLLKVSRDVVRASEDAARLLPWLDKPIAWTRTLVVLAGTLTVVVAVMMLTRIYRTAQPYSSIADMFQGFDALVNELLLLSGALYFLSTWETRIKRSRALAALHGLRSLAHIVDMHQLTKDPRQLRAPGDSTPSSPSRELTGYQLTRYLGYSSELLSLISKIAALHVQEFDDAVTLGTVTEIEGLCGGMSLRIWQKIPIIERGLEGQAEPEGV